MDTVFTLDVVVETVVLVITKDGHEAAAVHIRAADDEITRQLIVPLGTDVHVGDRLQLVLTRP